MKSKKIRVLTVEDDYLISEEISRILKQMESDHVGDASDGQEAVEMTCELHPDVILMDIKMPRMDGFEATTQIQKLCPTPIVILTAHESQDLVKRASKVGVGAYITKPPKQMEIERAITIAIARHEDLMTMKKLYSEVELQKKELEKAMAEIKTLRGIIPICGKCKKIRNDKGLWQQIEVYIHEHSGADFSHGLCPECAKELYGDLMKNI